MIKYSRAQTESREIRETRGGAGNEKSEIFKAREERIQSLRGEINSKERKDFIYIPAKSSQTAVHPPPH